MILLLMSTRSEPLSGQESTGASLSYEHNFMEQ